MIVGHPWSEIGAVPILQSILGISTGIAFSVRAAIVQRGGVSEQVIESDSIVWELWIAHFKRKVGVDGIIQLEFLLFP